MKRVLITGSNGLLGQKLLDLFKGNSEYTVLATSLGPNRYPDKEAFRYLSLDITNASQIEEVLKTFVPEVIINTAALTNVDICETEQEKCKQMNVDSVKYFLELLNSPALKNTQFIHLSTDFIFDGEQGPYAEIDMPNPLSVYGQSKWDAEKLILESGFTNYAILRTIIVYGVANEMSRSNIVLWAKQALEKGDEIKVVNDQFRMPTLAEDLAMACLLCIQKEAKGIYHISGPDYMSVLEMVQRIGTFYGLNIDLIKEIESSQLNQAAKRPARTGFILNKAKTDLDYNPHTFEEGLAIVKKQLNN